jgi:hypothetical protein
MAGQDLEAIGDIGAFDNLDGPASDGLRCVPQFGIAITAVCKDIAQHGITRGDNRQHIWGASAVLKYGDVDVERDGQSGRVGGDMAFAAVDPLTGAISSNSSTFRGFCALVWLSMTPAVGPALRPSGRRTTSTSLPLIYSSRPSLHQAQKQPRAVETGGKSLGNMCHWQPVVAIYRIASNISRRSLLQGDRHA